MTHDTKSVEIINIFDVIVYIRSNSAISDPEIAFKSFVCKAIDGLIIARGNNGFECSEFYPIPFDDWLDGEVNILRSSITGKSRKGIPIGHHNIFILKEDVCALWPEINIENQKPSSSYVGIKLKTGPKSDKCGSIVTEMCNDVTSGQLTRDSLRNMPEKSIINTYGLTFGASRTTCRKARGVALRLLHEDTI